MSIVDRVKNICLSPNTEWPVIASEPAAPGALITGYALPLMAIGAVAGFVGGTLIGYTIPFVGTVRTPVTTGLVGACIAIVAGVIGLFILSFLINAFAPNFGGQPDSTQAMKVAVYSYTPAWVAGVLQIVPALGVLGILAGLYGLYLLYLGLPVLMKSPRDKSMGYTIVVVLCAIVIAFVTTFVIGAIGFGAATAGALGSAAITGSGSSGDVQFDRDSPLGRLQELGKSMEKSNAEMEAAQRSGDPNAAAAAAMNSLGALFGGGRKVDPLEIDQLKAFVPETFAGLSRRGDVNGEKNGMAGLSVSQVEANFTDGAGKSVTLEITDSGGASGLMGLASWASLAGEKRDESGTEKTARVDGRMTHERDSKNGTDEFSVVVGERFMVSAKSSDVELQVLKAAVGALDLRRLESLKDAGVQK